MLLLVAIAVAVAMPAMPAQYSDRVNTLTDALPQFGRDDTALVDEPSYRGRASELIAGWQMFLDHPVGGVGAGNYVVHYQRYASDIGLDNRREDREAHNLYLEVASETGALGVVSFGVVIGLAAWGMRRGRRALPAGDRNLVGGLGAGLVAFLISGIFLHADYARPLWLLAAFGLAVGRLRTQVEPMPSEPSCQG
jgi:O-antigen ligase